MGAGLRNNSLFAVGRYDWYCGQPLSNAAVARLSLAARRCGYAIRSTLSGQSTDCYCGQPLSNAVVPARFSYATRMVTSSICRARPHDIRRARHATTTSGMQLPRQACIHATSGIHATTTSGMHHFCTALPPRRSWISYHTQQRQDGCSGLDSLTCSGRDDHLNHACHSSWRPSPYARATSLELSSVAASFACSAAASFADSFA